MKNRLRTIVLLFLVASLIAITVIRFQKQNTKSDIKSEILKLGYSGAFKDRDIKFEQLTGTMYRLRREHSRKITTQELFSVLGNPDLVRRRNDDYLMAEYRSKNYLEYVYFYDKYGVKWAAYIEAKDGFVFMFLHNDASVNDHTNYETFHEKPASE